MILDMYREHNQKLKQRIDISISYNTYIRHCTTCSHLGLFIEKAFRVSDLPIKEINNAFVQDFEQYLRVDRKCNNNSAVKYLKNFRKIIKYTLDNGWISKDPFLGIRFRLEKTNKHFLKVDELARLEKKAISIQRLEIIRDVFVFCSYTGLSFVDVKSLRYSDLKDEAGGLTWIEKPRQKTKVLSEIPLLPQARTLIAKYQHSPDKSDPTLTQNSQMTFRRDQLATPPSSTP